MAAAFSAILMLRCSPPAENSMPPKTTTTRIVHRQEIAFLIRYFGRILRIQPWEFWLSIVCFLGAAVFGAIPGIGLAVAIAVIEFLWDGWRPHSAVLGRPKNVEGYHDISRYPDARQIPGLVLFRWDAPLFFANAELCKERALAAVAESPSAVRWLVVAAETVTSVDVTAAGVLAELDETLHADGIGLCFSELKDPVKDKLKRFGLFEQIGQEYFFPTIETAVRSNAQKYVADAADGTN
jgi:MFS superfamily sulfate permease-like transporter